MARNVPRVKVDPPKMNEYLGLRKSTITRVYTVCKFYSSMMKDHVIGFLCVVIICNDAVNI